MSLRLRMTTASIATIFLTGCHLDHYAEEVAFAGNIGDFQEIFQEGRFFENHTYTISVYYQSVTESSVSHEENFSFPVYWNFDYERCRMQLETRSNISYEQVVVLQGVPSPDAQGLVVHYIAAISNYDVVADCGEAIDNINFVAAQQMYPLSPPE